MIWSFSDNRIFRSCQRQWYYKTHVASALATKDPLRREAYLLSKLQSIAAWRGSIVDRVISDQVVPYIQKKWALNPTKFIGNAKDLFEKQANFARKHRVREPGMSPAKEDGSFAAFYAMEYGSGVTDQDLEQAWLDIEQALSNLFDMNQVLSLLGSASYLVPQRNLTFKLDKATVRAIPDLIAFFDNRPPLIVDWKVHTFASRDYRLQLACYAIALTRCNPQRDFPSSLTSYTPLDIGLSEVQLLTKQHREYCLTNSDVDEVDVFIAGSSMEMALTLGDSLEPDLSPLDFPPTSNPETCQRCQYRSLCWKESKQWEYKQTSFL